MTTTTNPTPTQKIEQSIIDNPEFRKAFILDAFKECRNELGEVPTRMELHWFIFEHKGIRVDTDHIKEACIF